MDLQRLVILFPLVALLAWAAVVDVRCRRVPNWLTFALVLSGIAQSLTAWRSVTLGQSLAGLAVGFALPLVVYILGGMGAADVKLLAGVGSWLGPKTVLLVFAAAAVVGLVIILVQCLIQGKIMSLLRNTGGLIVNLLHVRHVGAREIVRSGKDFKSIDRPLPYAVHVLIGTIGVMISPLVSGKGSLP